MREDCFAYSKAYTNKCSALIGNIECSKCSFYRHIDTFRDEIKKNQNMGVYERIRGGRA